MAANESNRLRGETSPYLLQHALNPVDWYPWREEALARARAEDKPILLSIGYSACHWCHVMERESFEDEAIAALMNEHFVCIKVDREERPDLDDIYMAATVAMTGRGGWPMTVFLTPDQRPFFAGTYFPPTRRHGLPGFGELLARIAEAWREDRDDVEAQARQLTQAVRAQLGASAPAPVERELVARAIEQLAASYDARHGGFGGAPKFPPCPALRLALRHAVQTGDERALSMVRGTLDGMLRGGIYDHLGGGFARYSTDERWHVPHFEKMLYDNAQLARVYVDAHRVTGDPAYERVARETLHYALRALQAPEGGFYSATDADSEGVEGKFFTFTQAEIASVLDAPLARAFCAHYDVREEGNWEHTNVLWTPRAAADVAHELGVSERTLHEQLAIARERVFAAREQRVQPALDDKLLVSWNALLISALAEASAAFGEAPFREAAERAAERLLGQFVRPDGGLFRTARGDRVHLDAYLEDYAYLGNALIDLYECGADERYLRAARALAERMVRDFAADEGGFYFTANAHEPLIARPQDAQDDALPNATACAAELCARLAHHFAREDLRALAQRTVERFGALMARAPRAFATMLGVVDLLARGPVELALVGPAQHPDTRALTSVIGAAYLPHRVVAHGPGGESELPLLAGKGLVADAPALYVCRDFVCEAPLRDVASARRALESLRSG